MSRHSNSSLAQALRHHDRSRHVRVNWRLVGGLALSLAGAVGFGYYRYRTFQQIQLPLLWDLARRDLDHGDLSQALTKTNLYFGQRPDDIAALSEMAGWCLDGQLDAHTASRLYRQVTETARRHPHDPQLARLAFRLALRLAPVVPDDIQDSLWTDARNIHFTALSDEDRRDPVFRLGLARCHAALEESDRAILELLDLLDAGDNQPDTFRDLVDLIQRRNPTRPGSTSAELSREVRTRLLSTLASDEVRAEVGDNLWTSETREMVVDRVLERMVAQAEPGWHGLLVQSRTLAERGDLDRADDLARQAVARSDRAVETLVWLMDLGVHRAALAGEQHQWFEQRQHEVAAGEAATIGARLFPEDPRFHYELGRLTLGAGDGAGGAAHFRRALETATAAADNPHLGWARQNELGRLRAPALIWLGHSLVSQAVDDTRPDSSETFAELRSIHQQLDQWGLYQLAEMGRAQVHMLNREWDEAVPKWNVIAVDPDLAPWARLATAMLITCHTELGQWRELGVVAERAVAQWPGWEPGIAALELHYTRTAQAERLELFQERRREHDELLALAERYRTELSKPEGDRDLAALEREVEALGQTAEFARDLRVMALRGQLLHALGDNARLHDLLRDLQQKTPRVVELLVQRIEFELNRDDLPAERKVQQAAEALDLFRDAFDTKPRLGEEVVGPDSRLAQTVDRQTGPLSGVLRGLLRELAGDVDGAQQHLLDAFRESNDRTLPTQKLVEFYVRHRSAPQQFSDEFLAVAGPLLLKLSGDRGLVWAEGALEESRRRGTLSTADQMDLAQLYVRRKDIDRAMTAWEELRTQSPGNVAVLWNYSGLLAALPEPTAEQKARWGRLCGELEGLRPGSLESRLRSFQLASASGATRVAADLLEQFAEGLESRGTAGLLRSLAQLGRLEPVLERVTLSDEAVARRLEDQTRQLLSDPAVEVDEEQYHELTAQPALAAAVRTEVVALLSDAFLGMRQTDAAERLLRQTLTGRDDGVLALRLATIVGQQGGLNEALTAWMAQAGAFPAETAESITRVLAAQPDNLEWQRMVARFLWQVARADGLTPRQTPLLLLLAEFHMAPAQIARAIEVYEQVLRLEPNSAAVLNNLAYAEAFSEDRRELALRHIDAAIATDGPRRQYLDTRALVLLQLGRCDEARRELEHLTALVRSPQYSLHLAMAQHRLDNHDGAREALRQSREQGFDPAELSALEQPWFEELRPLYESLETSVAQNQR
ncbi:MAG: tetratricopeptide repeat protein [Planctomycetaceae bacterium]